MDRAVKAYVEGRISLDSVADVYNVPRMTVYRKAKKFRKFTMLENVLDA